MKPLVQYQIDADLSQDELRALWRRYLRKDARWHFFHEGSYSLIRIAEKNKGLEDWLSFKKKVKFSVGKWQDPHEHVRKYQDVFEPMFHAFSILGLVHKKDEYARLLNRVAHCFSNMCSRSLFVEASDMLDHANSQLVSTMFHASSEIMKLVNKLSLEVEQLKNEKDKINTK